MLLLSQERILRDLKKKYAHYTAKLGDEFTKMSKEEAYSILTFYHMSVQINLSINEYKESQKIEKSRLTNSSIVHLLSAVTGVILSHIDQEDPKYADAVLHNAVALTLKTRGE